MSTAHRSPLEPLHVQAARLWLTGFAGDGHVGVEQYADVHLSAGPPEDGRQVAALDVQVQTPDGWGTVAHREVHIEAMARKISAVERMRAERPDQLPVGPEAIRKAARDNLASFYPYGLRRRLGQHLVGDSLKVFLWMKNLGLEEPGVVVCEECNVVFETKAKARAQKCDPCHDHPIRPTHDRGLPTWIWPGYPERFGGGPRRAAVEATCEECGEPYWTTRSDSRFCGGTCRTRHYRS